MQARVWGPATWFFMHTVSFNYPAKPTPQQRRQYFAWIKSMGNVLPCGKCRENFKDNLCAAGFGMEVMQSRDTFSRFVWRLHDEVNKLLHKKSKAYEKVRDQYEGYRAKCLDKKGSHEGCSEPEFRRKKQKCIVSVVPLKRGS